VPVLTYLKAVSLRVLTQLNLNSLKVVESAARHKNFTRAGEEQFITASAVSQRIKSLEDQLRFKIFRRGGNAVSLTPEGEAYVAQVREALERIVAAGMEATGQTQEHILKISVLPTFAVRWLFPRMPLFQAKHPEIQMRISTSYEARDFLSSGLDVEIRYGDGNFPGLNAELLFKEDLTPVCSARLYHAVMGDKPLSKVRPEALRHFTLLHSDTCTQNWRAWLTFAGVEFVLEEAKSVYFDSCMMSYEAANAGMGFAVANRAYMTADIRSGQLVAPFAVHHPSAAGWYFVYPRRAGISRRMAVFRNWLIGEAELMQAQLDAELQ
jgi:LysR family transcriptional regulator, glycine cleavage system transcriptional activator